MKMFITKLLLILAPVICQADSTIFAENALIFSGNASHELAEKIAKELGVKLGEAKVSTFNDGEVAIRVGENVRNRDVFIVQSTCPGSDRSVNDNLMELYLLVRTMKRASAASITAVIPYYGYARQDRKTQSRVPISAADVATLLETAGIDRVVAVDLHCGQIQGFFRDVPVDNLFASVEFVRHYAAKKLGDKVVVVSPDAGGVGRAKQFMLGLQRQGVESSMAVIVKQRGGAGIVAQMNLVGNVEGASVVIVDDICDTAGTLVKAAQLLKDSGAEHVYAAITHPIFSGPALDRIRESALEELTIADSIPLSENAPSNIKQISMAPLLAETIRRIQNGESISELFG